MHPAARHDALTAARHRAFIAPRLIGGAVAIASFPAYLIARGAPTVLECGIFGWFVAPILSAYFLSRTGRYETAHILSSLALAGLVTIVAASTGGIESFATAWLVIVPLEASLSASRRVVAIASAFALAAAGILYVVGRFGPPQLPVVDGRAALAELGVVLAALYAAGLASAAAASTRAHSLLTYAEEDRYRLLAYNMTDVIARYGRDGAVLFVSPAAQSLFGCNIAELHGHGLFSRVHIADRPAYLSALGDAAALAESRSVAFRVRREAADTDGWPTTEFTWIEMRCQPLELVAAEAGDRREIIAVLRDMTERKRLEQALQDARAEAERADAAKGRFLVTVSQDLRTPLNAIIGFSDTLSKEPALELDCERRRELAGLINQSGHHLLAVINGILDMSKIEIGNFEITPEPLAPAQVIAACCDLVAVRAEEAGIGLVKNFAGELPEIVADKGALRQILLNLLSNAIRFTDRGGKVTIGARAEAGAIVFVVEDNGIGISGEDLARVGEPHFQARAFYDRSRGGTGVGLSIVEGLVRLHGGEINIHSRFGEGTRVCVRLPLDCTRAGQRPKEAVRAAVDLTRYGARRLSAHASNFAPARERAGSSFMRVKKSA